ncbi:hypothetical protein [Singulisphaera sp. PoT]|uniref:hypothetical protein n=1 Tax=Singulisphaera sp. PoT TaxID=3411797 RepID=UPI003BF59886
MAEPDAPAPTADAVTETVDILKASQAGDLVIEARGNGQDRVRLGLKNTSTKRLKVVIPPGLVASATAQGGGRGFQSMGLGTVTNQPGSFGEFRAEASNSAGFHSVAVAADVAGEGAVTVPAGQRIELIVPGVCLNFGAPTPTLRDSFHVVDVDQYTNDPRARKALRSLATLGTSQGVAQAAVWSVFNGVSFEQMTGQASPKVMNVHEVALASRFVQALDASGDSEILDGSYLKESRLLVSVAGEGKLSAEAGRLAESLNGLHILGLPVRVLEDGQIPQDVQGPAMALKITLSDSKPGETKGRIVVSHATPEGWAALGRTNFEEGSAVTVLDGPGLARAVDQAVASAFVGVKVTKKGANGTTLRIENRLPFSIANVVLKTGNSSGAPDVSFKGMGIGPARSASASIQAAGGVVHRVELNGL